VLEIYDENNLHTKVGSLLFTDYLLINYVQFLKDRVATRLFCES